MTKTSLLSGNFTKKAHWQNSHSGFVKACVGPGYDWFYDPNKFIPRGFGCMSPGTPFYFRPRFQNRRQFVSQALYSPLQPGFHWLPESAPFSPIFENICEFGEFLIFFNYFKYSKYIVGFRILCGNECPLFYGLSKFGRIHFSSVLAVDVRSGLFNEL